jgi:hypothetical protein
MRVVGVRRRHWVRVAVSCRPACLFKVVLYGHRRGARARLARLSTRTAGLHPKRRVFKLKIRRAGSIRARGRLHAVAVTASGVTKRARTVRIR